MAEHLIVRQNNKFEIEFLARDPHDPESDTFHPVTHIHELTPYTMLLASLGACTAIVLHTYTQNHDVELHEVELHLHYERVFQDDCENCEQIERYEEQITEALSLRGDLSEPDRQKLFRIAHQCSVHKLMESGIQISSQLSKPGGEE